MIQSASKVSQSSARSKGLDGISLAKSRTRSQQQHAKTAVSRYGKGNIPTDNLKFEQFLDILLNSGLDRDTIKNETRKYVQVMETNYNDKIRAMRDHSKKLEVEVKKNKTTGVNEVVQKKDLEQLFVDCVEDMRRNIIRRRLRAEINSRKKVGGATLAKQTMQTQSLDIQSHGSSFESK